MDFDDAMLDLPLDHIIATNWLIFIFSDRFPDSPIPQTLLFVLIKQTIYASSVNNIDIFLL